ncbi:peptide-methionine (S)-S-oxide reductase MsrA [Spiroplasma endosymbiont of Panorpa germanica]|uniref:peptide-methionine (S)-S-oxide reductase MsrA n=1 Tax=Spiroplasma endosymbiont of Panorpa germanica TaxID=3066314 RepID=UPI0030CD64D4
MNQTITLAAGCFWGVQAYFDKIEGVKKTTVGYANGNREFVTYEEVCSENTGFVEVCQVEFENKIISLESILEKYWSIIDPTLKNRQGNDFGSQYRTGIYYNIADENSAKTIIDQSLKNIALKYSKPILTEVKALNNYIKAEGRHQKYLEKNPNGYCHIKL